MTSVPVQASSSALNPSFSRHIAWYLGGILAAFLLPFVFSSTLDLGNDLYYLIYFCGAIAFLAIYAIATELDVGRLFTRSWRWSLGLGIVTAAFLVIGVLQREDSTPHPDGLYFVFSIATRGILYGIVDALLLTAFPVAVAYTLFSERIDSIARRAGFAALALALSLIITATYHLGYEQFREDGVAGPETGNAIISLPALVTANPLGSVIAHASMHVAADIHAYETELYLPPRTLVKSGGPALPSEIQLEQSDSGRRVELARDGVLVVALASNPSTGFRWTVASLPDGLRQEGDASFVPAGSTQPVVGAGGTEVFRFTAQEAGSETLELVYSRSFEPGSQERSFSVEVVIQ